MPGTERSASTSPALPGAVPPAAAALADGAWGWELVLAGLPPQAAASAPIAAAPAAVVIMRLI
jgi:hypothetical protein